MTEHTNTCGCPGCNWYEQDNQPPDPLTMLEAWMTIQPSHTMTPTERANLLQDIEAAANEIRRLRQLNTTKDN